MWYHTPMSGLKDSLNKKSKTVTISADDKAVLVYMHQFLQTELDMLQQRMAARFLNYLATEKFGFDGNADLRFNYDPEKEVDNLTITEVREP